MKKPLLVGLNDQISVNKSNWDQTSPLIIKDLGKCFNPMSVTDTPLSYKNLWAGHANATRDEMNNTVSIWANLYNFDKTKNVEVRNDKILDEKGKPTGKNIKLDDINVIVDIDTDNYLYTQFKACPIFTDDFGNKIFVLVTDNPLHKTLWEKGYFGSKNEKDFIVVENNNDKNGDRAPSKILGLYSFWNQNNSISKLEGIGIGKKILDKPVLMKVYRNAGISIGDWSQYLGTVVGLILQVIPIVGTATGMAIIAAVNIGAKYINNPDYQLSANDITDLGKNLGPVMFTEGGSTMKFFNDGLTTYKQLQNGNYTDAARSLGISPDSSYLKNLPVLSTYQGMATNIVQQVQKFGDGSKSYDQINQIVQAVSNLQTNANLVNAAKALSSGKKENSEMISQIDANHSLASSQEFYKLMVMYSGGGYTPALATNADGQDTLMFAFNKLSEKEKTPEIHRAFLLMSSGIPTGTKAFDELLLTAIENQIVSGNLKSFNLPAQIPPEKRNCIKAELTKYGITVFDSANGYIKNVPVPTKENTYSVKKAKFRRNFK